MLCYTTLLDSSRKHVTARGRTDAEKRLLRETKCSEARLEQILVVCYTNHALDQFLEGMLDFCPKEGKAHKYIRMVVYNIHGEDQ